MSTKSTNRSQNSSRARSLRTRRPPFVCLVLIALLSAGLTFLILRAVTRTDEPLAETPTPDVSVPITDPTPSFIDLQPTVDAWLSTVDFSVGLEIYDLDHQEIAASYHADQTFAIASIYKLFFVYPLYAAISAGQLDPNAYFVTTQDYRADSYTLGQCLDLVVRESYNGCADPIRQNSTFAASASQFITDLGLEHTTNLGLYSTAADLIDLLRHYYAHTELSDASWSQLADSLLNQPATTVAAGVVYDWRQGLPSGFSADVQVYDKVGWAYDGDVWTTYADAALLDFPSQNRHYAIVVLTSGIATEDPYPLRDLATRLEAAITAAN